MFVHVKYGMERGDRVMEFSSNSFTTVNDVIEVRPVHGSCCTHMTYVNRKKMYQPIT